MVDRKLYGKLLRNGTQRCRFCPGNLGPEQFNHMPDVCDACYERETSGANVEVPRDEEE